jgi:hypothetical protein
MENNTMRRLCEYLHELRSGRWNNYRASEHPAFDTTIEDDSNWDQRDQGGDGRQYQHNKG